MEYEFCDMDLANTDDINNVYDFLSKNYYLHDDEFMLTYSVDQIRWIFSLTDVTGDNRYFCFAYVIKNTKIIVGFILGVFVKFVINDEEKKMTEVSLLCAHNKLRKKNFAKIIVDEYVRRYSLCYYPEAIYIGSRLLPPPHTQIGRSKYYHRPLSLPILLECEFTSYEPYRSKKEKIAALRLNANYKNLYELTLNDVSEACEMLMKYLKRFKLYPLYDTVHFINTFCNNNFVKCFVYKTKPDGPILDIISYYLLPLTKLSDNAPKAINTAYLFYYSNNNGYLTDMVRNLMIKLRNEQYHLFNALNIMENGTFLDELKFEDGTGEPYYFIYNYDTSKTKLLPNQIGKIIF